MFFASRITRIAAIAAHASAAVSRAISRATEAPLQRWQIEQIRRRAAREGRYNSTWTPNGTRECQRRMRQNAHQRQLDSHVGFKPKHIFNNERTEERAV